MRDDVVPSEALHAAAALDAFRLVRMEVKHDVVKLRPSSVPKVVA
jgi:hypothetical protein